MLGGGSLTHLHLRLGFHQFCTATSNSVASSADLSWSCMTDPPCGLLCYRWTAGRVSMICGAVTSWCFLIVAVWMTYKGIESVKSRSGTVALYLGVGTGIIHMTIFPVFRYPSFFLKCCIYFVYNRVTKRWNHILLRLQWFRGQALSVSHFGFAPSWKRTFRT
jgi:hypothetical protein